MELSIPELQAVLSDFAEERDWKRFHTPKNLAMALAGEIGELVSIFQWLTSEESAGIMRSPRRAELVESEIADVFSYLLQLAGSLDIDLELVLAAKIEKNRERYPIKLSYGHAGKYTELVDVEDDFP